MLVPSQENLIKLILIKDIITRVQQLQQPRQPPRPVLPVGICGGCRINSLPRILNRIFILFKKIQLAASPASEATAEITRGCHSLNLSLSLQSADLIANIYTQILIRQTHLFHQRQELPGRKHPKPEILNVITHHDLMLSVSAKCLHTCVCVRKLGKMFLLNMKK